MSITEKSRRLEKLEAEIRHELEDCGMLMPHIVDMMAEAAKLADELRRS